MAKSRRRVTKKHDTGRALETPSFFGSHSSMVANHEDYDVELKEGEVLCQDGETFYVTLKQRLDTGLADPKRYSGKKLKLEKGKKDGRL